MFIGMSFTANPFYYVTHCSVPKFVILNIGPKLLGEQAIFPSIYKLFFFVNS